MTLCRDVVDVTITKSSITSLFSTLAHIGLAGQVITTIPNQQLDRNPREIPVSNRGNPHIRDYKPGIMHYFPFKTFTVNWSIACLKLKTGGVAPAVWECDVHRKKGGRNSPTQMLQFTVE